MEFAEVWDRLAIDFPEGNHKQRIKIRSVAQSFDVNSHEVDLKYFKIGLLTFR